MMNMKEQRRYLGISTKAMEANTSTKKKITDYCIIDHIGALESEEVMKKAYALAYELSQCPRNKTYKFKQILQMGAPYTIQEVSQKQKTMIRMGKNPKQVVVIVSGDKYYYEAYQCCPTSYMAEGHYKGYDSNTKWILDKWAEKAECVKVILCEEGCNLQIIDYIAENCPWKTTFEATNSVYRRCANIWGNALGWSFSAPLYRDYVGGVNEGFQTRSKCDFNENLRASLKNKGVSEEDIQEALSKEQERCRAKADKSNKTSYSYLIINGKRNNERAYKDDAKDPMQNHMSKISSKPSKFIKSIAVASEEECIKFFEYYKYLKMTNLIEASLEPGYQLCPHCGRPIAIDVAQLNLKETPDEMFESTKTFKLRDQDRTCNHCDLVIPAELFFETSTYYDDTYDDEEDDYLDESFITKIYSSDTYEEDEM